MTFITGYLNSLKIVLIILDPHQKWINAYNQLAMVFSKFYKWLTQPDIRPRAAAASAYAEGLRFILGKGPKSHMKPTDLWSLEYYAVFLKYCQNARLACYHTMSRDTPAR
jgi:hypothetical protein